MTTPPPIEKSRLENVKYILEWFLVIFGAALYFLPGYFVFFGALSIILFFIGYYISISYRKRRLEKARQKTPIKIEPLTPIAETKTITKTSDAQIVARVTQARGVIKQRVVGLRRSYTEFRFQVNRGERLHLRWDSEKPFVLHLLDSWHSSRSDFTTTLFSELLAIKGEETIVCPKTDELTILMASTAKYQDPRVTIEAWIE